MESRETGEISFRGKKKTVLSGEERYFFPTKT